MATVLADVLAGGGEGSTSSADAHGASPAREGVTSVGSQNVASVTHGTVPEFGRGVSTADRTRIKIAYSNLWLGIQELYREYPPESGLNQLMVNM